MKYSKGKYSVEFGQEIFVDKEFYRRNTKPVMTKREKEIARDNYRQIFNLSKKDSYGRY